MGCWNETCALTNLPICSGDRAVYIPLLERDRKLWAHRGNVSYYYPDDLFSMIGFPIRGTYDDYGTLEKMDETPGALLTLDVFKALQAEDKIEIKLESYDKVNKIVDLDSLMHLVERERVHYDNGRAITFMAMHEGFFDAIIANMLKRKMSPRSNTFESEIQLSLQAAKDKTDEINAKYKIEDSDTVIDRASKEALKFHSHLNLENEISYLFRYSSGSTQHVTEGQRYYDYILSHTHDKDLVKEVVDLFAFDSAMLFLRKMYAPQSSGKGSQGTERDLHAVLAKGILDMRDKRKKEYEDDCGCEGDFNPTQESLFNFHSLRSDG